MPQSINKDIHLYYWIFVPYCRCPSKLQMKYNNVHKVYVHFIFVFFCRRHGPWGAPLPGHEAPRRRVDASGLWTNADQAVRQGAAEFEKHRIHGNSPSRRRWIWRRTRHLTTKMYPTRRSGPKPLAQRREDAFHLEFSPLFDIFPARDPARMQTFPPLGQFSRQRIQGAVGIFICYPLP